MNLRDILTVALVALLIAPVATAHVPTEHSAPETGEPANLPATATATASASDGATAEDSNYTRLYIEEGYRHGEVKPGESTTFNVTVGNGEDRAVDLDPHVVLPKVEGRPIEEEWVTIEDEDTTLDADEERTFTITVDVPSDVELGEYRAHVAFTNETVTYRPGEPERPVHSAQINVDVFEEPTVRVRSDRYYRTQIQAGNSYSYEIVVENTGDEAVPLNPTVETQESRRHHHGGDEQTAQRSWFDVEAPSEVAPGEEATVTVTVTPPDSASVGDYRAEVNLGLKDPARPERRDHWQRVDLNFQVWQQPENPYETSFQVSDSTENVTLTLSAGQYGQSATDDPVSFDVEFVRPDGKVVDYERVEVSDGGHVSLGDDRRRGETQGPYTSGGENKEFVYRVTDPGTGEWSVRIMPHHTTDFRYEVVRDES